MPTKSTPKRSSAKKIKPKTTSRYKRPQRQYSYYRRKKPSRGMRLLQKLPSWAWWIGGFAVAAIYIGVFYYFFVSPFGYKWRAIYGDVSYPEGYEIHGIDISHYQGDIDWAALKNHAMIEKCPVRFVVIKATEGSDRLDERFSDNFCQAREYGFIRGAYHFWSTTSSAEAQAKYYICQVRLEPGDLPPVLDVEHKPKEQTDEQFRDSVLKWLEIVEACYKVKPIIYTYFKFKKKYLDDEVFDEYPYWIAHYYVDKIEYDGEWKFWQHTDCGRLPGIKGYVDFDIYNGSYYDLRRLTIGNQPIGAE